MEDYKNKPQKQDRQPGREEWMEPQPAVGLETYQGAGKLKDKVAIITGGDSGIGRAVAVAFAKEEADVVVVYLNEEEDAAKTQSMVEELGQECLLISGDIGDEQFCRDAVEETIEKFGKLDILVNNAAEQHVQKNIMDISQDQLLRTFQTNIFGMFFMTKAALPHLKEGATIVNTTSVTAYRGSPSLLDYSSTKGAIVAFTRSLALQLIEKKIRVNGVAPGPVWTPLIPATFEEERVKEFGTDTPMKRAAQPEEIAPSYVFLASDDSSYMTGEILHPNGGDFMSS